MQIMMQLEKEARKSGGDKYGSKDQDLVIYFPQAISRVNGVARPVITLTIAEVE